MEVDLDPSLFGKNSKIQSPKCKILRKNQNIILPFAECLTDIEENEDFLIFKASIFAEPTSITTDFKIWGIPGSDIVKYEKCYHLTKYL